MILITGSCGLIGHAVKARLAAQGLPVREFDIARSPAEDTRNDDALTGAIEGVEGIVHLAAVSRVVWAQQDPQLAQAVNVAALRSLLAAAHGRRHRPWVIFASSREVYGEAGTLPVSEDAPLAPLNVYARSKVAGERLMAEARQAGIVANVVRFSNVYGWTADHPDRVVPAFARAAAFGGRLRLDGAETMFDFTHIDDVAEGMALHIAATRAGEPLPPVHFVTGMGTTLRELAATAVRTADQPPDTEIACSRTYDVARFVGDPALAEHLLGWRSRIGIDAGFARLASEYRVGAPRPISRQVVTGGG